MGSGWNDRRIDDFARRVAAAVVAAVREELAAADAALVHGGRCGRGPRDAADAALVLAVARAVGDRVFTACELCALAEVGGGDLGAALLAADITNAKQLGRLLGRLVGHAFGGVTLACVEQDRRGNRWRLFAVNAV